jgi:hypothetical protein
MRVWQDLSSQFKLQTSISFFIDHPVKFNHFLLAISDKHIGLMLQRYLHESYEAFMKNLLTACKENTDLVEVPVKVKLFVKLVFHFSKEIIFSF